MNAFMTFGQLAIYSQKLLHKNVSRLSIEESNESIQYSDDLPTDINKNSDPVIEKRNIEEIDHTCNDHIGKSDYEDWSPEDKVGKVQSDTLTRRFKICQFCGKPFSNLKVHIQRCHGDFKCGNCQQSFKTQDELLVHEELHGDNQFPCEECNLSFKRAYDSAIHSRQHSAINTYQCPICEFRSASKPSIKIHIKHHEKDYRYECDLCGKGFVNKSGYTEHVEAHSGIKKFQCDICNKSFLYNRYLKVHRKLNHQKVLEGVEEIHECDVCNRRFSFAKSLIRHLSKIHGIGKDNSVHCTICLKKISNPYNLKMHMRTHTGEKPFACEFCGRTFSKRIYLRKHRASHEIAVEVENQSNDDDIINLLVIN